MVGSAATFFSSSTLMVGFQRSWTFGVDFSQDRSEGSGQAVLIHCTVQRHLLCILSHTKTFTWRTYCSSSSTERTSKNRFITEWQHQTASAFLHLPKVAIEDLSLVTKQLPYFCTLKHKLRLRVQKYESLLSSASTLYIQTLELALKDLWDKLMVDETRQLLA